MKDRSSRSATTKAKSNGSKSPRKRSSRSASSTKPAPSSKTSGSTRRRKTKAQANPSTRSPRSASGWTELRAAATPAETKILTRLRRRIKPPFENLAQLIDVARTPGEVETLTAAVARLDPAPPPAAASADAVPADAYERHKARTAARQRKQSAAGRDIGPLPPPEDPRRRERCRNDLARFIRTYKADEFFIPLADYQLELIADAQAITLNGGNLARAAPRGGAKTSIFEAAAEWGILYGHVPYALIVAANDDKADDVMESIALDLETNDALAADFPEICLPIRALGGIAQAARGQHIAGERTRMQWAGWKRVFPTVAGSESSGAILACAGVHSKRIRGLKHRRRDGRQVRPTLALIDDVQNEDDSASFDTTEKLERIITGAIAGTGGPQQRVAMLLAITAQLPDDLACRFLNRERHPHWRGKAYRMLDAFPDNMELWEQYAELRRESVVETPEGGDPAPAATAFYRRHRRRMKAGAVVTWKERKDPHHLDALQAAMDLFFDDERVFWSEYQNEPKNPETQPEEFLTREQIATRFSGYDRGVIPADTQWLVTHVDVHDRVLYYVTYAAGRDFSGSFTDYGTFPETDRATFYAGRFRPTLRETFPGTGLEGAIVAGLDALAEQLLKPTFTREDGAELQVALMLVDAGHMAATVKRWIRASPYRARIMPAIGRTIGPQQLPINRYKPRTGELIGDEWLIRLPSKGRGLRHVIVDHNHWKTFLHRRLATAAGDPGALALYGQKDSRQPHAFLARHLTAEKPALITGDRAVTLWTRKAGETENHWLDNAYNCLAAASICGARVAGSQAPPPPQRRRKRRKVKL